MKPNLSKIVFIAVCFFALATSTIAQSAVSVYIRDSNPGSPYPPHSFSASIVVWDNSIGAQVGTTQYISGLIVDQYNPIYTTVTVPVDGSPRWRIIISVSEYDANSNFLSTHNRQTGLLNTSQYETGYYIPIVVNPITFP